MILFITNVQNREKTDMERSDITLDTTKHILFRANQKSLSV